MKFTEQSLVHVYFNGFKNKHLMGRLLLKNRQLFFEYDINFLKLNLQLSPFKLPLKSGIIKSNDRVYDGLFGVFNDSLPDGWGKLLLDRRLMSLGFNPGNLSVIDRLCFVGSHGMGALSYEPENVQSTYPINQDLDKINYEIQNFLEKEDNHYLDELLALNGSSAGARPKILLQINDEDWLIKFRSTLDPKDIGCIEYAYHLMAKEAGLDVPTAKLFPSKKSAGYFGVKRFDRDKEKTIHMHTVAGLLHIDHREPTLDYETLMKVTLYLTRDVRECEKQYRNAVFNILSHNRDDHSKNFSFLMDDSGVWHISPSYDLTFSSGPNGEHSTMIMGEGKNPQKIHLLKLAEISGIKKEKAQEIIEQVSSAISHWKTFAREANVTKSQLTMIEKSLNSINTKL